MTTATNESPSGFEVARWGSHLCTPKMGGTIRDMTTERLIVRSITGRPLMHVMFREVWPDQIDDLNTQCGVCQQFNRLVSCNVYVPTEDGGSALVSACRCCAAGAALDHPGLDAARDAIVEYAKED